MMYYDPDRAGILNGRLFRAAPLGSVPKDPNQGELFNADEAEAAYREAALDRHKITYTGGWGEVDPGIAESSVRDTMRSSRMPSDLIKALGGNTFVSDNRGDFASNQGGFYTSHNDRIVVRGTPSHGTVPETVIHELGHRADFRSMMAASSTGIPSSREEVATANDPDPAMRKLGMPDSRKEGVADGFADRYMGRSSDDLSHHGSTGYSVNHYSWDGEEKARYTATRAHFDKAGEVVPGGEGAGAYMRRIMQSPHAQQAVSRFNLDQFAKNSAATRNWPVGTQLSAFPDLKPDKPVYRRGPGI